MAESSDAKTPTKKWVQFEEDDKSVNTEKDDAAEPPLKPSCTLIF